MPHLAHMLLKEVQNIFNLYRHAVDQNKYPTASLWTSAAQFKENWSFDTAAFAEMFDRAISEELISNLFPKTQKPIKPVILKMADKNPVALRQMFLDLLYDRVDLHSRCEHFGLECDAHLKLLIHEVGNPFNHHFHDRYEVLSMYLTLRFPDKYVFYDHPQLVSFLKKVGAKNIPFKGDVEKYNLLHRTIHTLAQKDIALMDGIQLKIKSTGFQDPNLFLAFDIIRFANTL